MYCTYITRVRVMPKAFVALSGIILLFLNNLPRQILRPPRNSANAVVSIFFCPCCSSCASSSFSSSSSSFQHWWLPAGDSRFPTEQRERRTGGNGGKRGFFLLPLLHFPHKKRESRGTVNRMRDFFKRIQEKRRMR